MAQGLGTDGLEQQISYRLTRTNGNTYTRRWEGSKTALDAIADAEAPYADDIDFKGQGPTGVLTVTYTNNADAEDEVTSETQELDTEPVGQSIFINPTFQDLLAEEVHEIRKQFETKAEDYAAAITAINAKVASGRQAIAAVAFDHLLAGAETFENFTFTLTRTRNASRRYTGTFDLSAIGKIWDGGDLIDYTGNPLLFSVPSVVCTTAETAKGYVAGWRMRVCRVADVSNGSRNLIEVWQLAKWSSYLYDTYEP